MKDGSGRLERFTSVESAHLADPGHRPSFSKHWESIRVNPNRLEEVQGARILLFDDVITTGNTALACRRHLLQVEAVSITGIYLGKTWGREMDIEVPF